MLAAASSVVLLSHANRSSWQIGRCSFEHWGGHFPVAEAGGLLSVSLNFLHQLPVHHLWRAISLVQGADQIFEGIRMQPPPLEIPAWSSSEDKVCPQSTAFLMPC